jgi:hypothetical protein
MRTSLFASTLFTVSLIGGVALAEKPHVVDQLRARGDIVDKAYAAPRAASAGPAFASPGVQAPAPSHPVKLVVDRAASRVNCSDAEVNCAHASGGHAVAVGGRAPAAESARTTARRPASLDKAMGSDRTNFNEAGEDQGMSVHAAQRAWSHGAAGGGADAGGAASKSVADRQGSSHETGESAGVGRMSCNEADACSMANKDVRKIWANASAAAGTLAGSERARAAVAADTRLAAARRAESAANARQQATEASHGASAGHAHAAGSADHQH